ncbi:MAG: DnaJ domain-containing protein [Deltaproteobacteria bacterium]|nr:DnaJ domain-containing protein [Deltaproteobacteria bacterium]
MADYTEPQFWPVLKQLAQNIDGMDYYQILNLAQDATPADIKGSYYGQSRSLHPDKFYHLDDGSLKDAVHKIYKRVTEAYNVLRDDRKRKVYTANINGPSRATKLRFDEATQEQAKEQEKQEKEVTTNPKAKPLYLKAVQQMNAGNWEGAFKDLQTAVMFDGGNEKLKALKDEVDKRRKEKK